MPKAIYNGAVIAESEQTRIVEGNHYFPPESLNREFLRPSETQTVCPWKGTASYFDVVVDGERDGDAAWYYPKAREAAKHIEGYVAFWKGVKVDG